MRGGEDDDEEMAAALTKLAADLSRIPRGTRVQLSLLDGEVLTGAKLAFGAKGIEVDGYGFTPFVEVAGFETVR